MSRATKIFDNSHQHHRHSMRMSRLISILLCAVWLTCQSPNAYAGFRHRRVVGDGGTQNIYGMNLKRNEFKRGKVFGADGRSLRHNYFGPPLERSQFDQGQYRVPNRDTRPIPLYSSPNYVSDPRYARNSNIEIRGSTGGWTELSTEAQPPPIELSTGHIPPIVRSR